MTRPTKTKLTAAAVALALAVASCTDDPGDPGASPTSENGADATESVGEGTAGDGAAVIAFDNPDADDFNKLIDPVDGLEALQPAEILNVEGTLSADETSGLIIGFEMGSHHCYGVITEVTESATEVVVRVETGQLPDVDPRSCAIGVYPYTTLASLDAPLGDRTIVPAEQREPADLAGIDGEGSGGSSGTDGTDGGTDGEGSGESSGTDGTDGGTDGEGGTDGTGDGDDDDEGGVEPDGSGAGAGTEGGGPMQGGGVNAPAIGPAQLIGMFVEDGVAWAIDNGVEWRILTYDGDPVDAGGPDDPTRLSFVVERDRIVSFEWS